MADTPDLGKLWKQLTDNIGDSVGDVLDKLKNSSIGEQVQSWIGKGENKPVDADQVTQAIGQERMDQIAQQTGTTPQQAAQTMADKLPGMVDKMTPDGQIPDAQSMDPQSIKDNVAGGAGQATPRAMGTSTSASGTGGGSASAGSSSGTGGTTPTPGSSPRPQPPRNTPNPPAM